MNASEKNIARLNELKNYLLLEIKHNGLTVKSMTPYELVDWKIEDVEKTAFLSRKKSVVPTVTELHIRNASNINSGYVAVHTNGIERLLDIMEDDRQNQIKVNIAMQSFGFDVVKKEPKNELA